MAKKPVKETIHTKGIDIGIYTYDFENEYVSLTDIARYKSDDPNAIICNWMRNRDTLEFLGLWESLHNADFKPLEFEGFRSQAGLNAFTMSPSKWINGVGAIGIVAKSGRYGGTYAHSDIAFEFASWISAEFKLYIIKDYKRLKMDEDSRLSLGWNLNREIAKINYRIHTDAIKDNLIPPELTKEQIAYTYASEMENNIICLRCGEKMNYIRTEKLQLGQTGWILGDIPNLLAGAMEVDIYSCPKCRKIEFFLAETEEGLPQKQCPNCGKRHDFDYPKCPFCKYSYND